MASSPTQNARRNRRAPRTAADPQRAVFSKNGDKFVTLYDPSKDGGIGEEVKIIAGVRGSDGNIEVLEGLQEGDKITIDSRNQ